MSRIASREPAAPHLTGRLSRSDLLWVANTAHGPAGHWHARVRGPEPDHDHLETPERARTYLADHGVPVPAGLPDEASLAELAIVRGVVARLVTPMPAQRTRSAAAEEGSGDRDRGADGDAGGESRADGDGGEDAGANGVGPWTDDGRALLEGATFALTPNGRIVSTEPGWRGFSRDLLVPLVALIEEGVPLGRCSNPRCRLVFHDQSRNHGRRWCDTGGCGNRDRVRRARTRPARWPASGAQGRQPATEAWPGREPD